MKQPLDGYYRFPALFEDKIAFVCEDDLWLITENNMVARRLTATLGEISYPCFSPDGTRIAYISNEEGSAEVFVIDISGGLPEKLTELGAKTTIAGWNDDGIIISTDWQKPFTAMAELYYLDLTDGNLTSLNFGPARNIAISQNGLVIGRNTADPSRWKRYRGGTAGELWIKPNKDKNFVKLLHLAGNLASPFWINDRLFFISDFEQCGNLYSVMADGSSLKKHTDLSDFYVRQAVSDGERVVFQAGGDLYLFNPATDDVKKLNICYQSSYSLLKRRFIDAEEFLEDYDLFPDGSRMVYNIRGRIFTMGNWEGAVVQHGKRDGVRYRFTRWLKDGFTLLTASDEGGEYHLELYDICKELPVKTYNYDIGIIQELSVAPSGELAVFNNHRHELIVLNLRTSEFEKIEQNRYGIPEDLAWSPDSKWIVYASPVSLVNTVIKLYNVSLQTIKPITQPVLKDSSPCFDPDGRYIYFLSSRIFNPVSDNLHFDLNFPQGMKPYLILLQKDLTSPFTPFPHGFKDLEEEPESLKTPKSSSAEPVIPPIKIDLNGIEDRIVPFPVAEGLYSKISATRDRVFYLEMPVQGALDLEEDENEYGTLRFFDLKDLVEDEFAEGVEDFKISDDLTAIFYQSTEGLRVLDINYEPDPLEKMKPQTPRTEGWLDLERIKVAILPKEEWRQMFAEAWRLQRDYFWSDDMSGLDWLDIYNRYLPLVERVASRTEFSDLIWELQGELGTSHAYEFGGDYRQVQPYHSAFLGADFVYDEKFDAYKIAKIHKGDLWLEQSPLKAPGLNINEGHLLVSISGQRLSKKLPPYKLLVGQSGQMLEIGVADKNCKGLRFLTVQSLKSEQNLRYRDWTEANRSMVHKMSKNKIGYLHIPDMDFGGYAEFHRYFLNEYDYEGLIIDVRYNAGGYVSQLLLEKLSRKRLGFELSRWSAEQPYPTESAKGPMIVITNEHAGSDGDIFCHAFKLLKLGKLIGKRTWGGVVAIWPRNWLVDGTITTQPEFSFWFKDIGYNMENRGAEPDIEVEITPENWSKRTDSQLEKAIELLSSEIKQQVTIKPDYHKKEKPKLG